MRHRKDNKRLSRQSAHRKATLRNQVKALFLQEAITTTLVVAKQSRRLAEKLITMAKEDTVAARRRVYAILGERDLVKLLFGDIAKRVASRNGGYTRIIHAGKRHGDNAAMAILELTDRKEKEKKEPKEKKEKKTAKPAAKEGKKADAKAESGADKENVKSKKEKNVSDAADKEQANAETGDEKGFLGGLRKFLKQDKPE